MKTSFATCDNCEENKECYRLWAIGKQDKPVCVDCIKLKLVRRQYKDYAFCLGFI